MNRAYRCFLCRHPNIIPPRQDMASPPYSQHFPSRKEGTFKKNVTWREANYAVVIEEVQKKSGGKSSPRDIFRKKDFFIFVCSQNQISRHLFRGLTCVKDSCATFCRIFSLKHPRTIRPYLYSNPLFQRNKLIGQVRCGGHIIT